MKKAIDVSTEVREGIRKPSRCQTKLSGLLSPSTLSGA